MAEHFLSSYKSENFEILVNQYLPEGNKFTEQRSRSRSRSPNRAPVIPVPCEVDELTAKLMDAFHAAAAARASEKPDVLSSEPSVAAADQAQQQSAAGSSQDVACNDAEPAVAAKPATPEQPSPEVQAQLRTLLDEVRRLKNEDRGGRNALYWQIRKTWGEAAARPFYVAKASPQPHAGVASPPPAQDAGVAPQPAQVQNQYALYGVAPPPPAVRPGVLRVTPPPPAVRPPLRRVFPSTHVCTKGCRYVENPVWLSFDSLTWQAAGSSCVSLVELAHTSTTKDCMGMCISKVSKVLNYSSICC